MRCLMSLTLLALSAATACAGGEEINFNRDIKPILSDKCYACHGPDAGQRQGGGEHGLRLDIKDGAFADLGGHFALVPGKPQLSELVRRVTSNDPDEVMPPPDHRKALTADERGLLVRWVESGARWADHWAYEPLTSRRVGSSEQIDRLIHKRLAAEGLKPSPPAEKRILIRRVFFDLIGLPPSHQEVQRFLADNSANAWETLIDQLLASPHFGERMAVYWLDLVRYADTVGYHGDQDVSVSPYRDYVINAFNSNMPFDRFTREQLAGDLMENPTRDQMIASGYNKLGMMSAEGGAQPKEYLTKYASDRVRTASTVWLGSTLGCAECHDHKFDPFTQKDFYRFAAFFADIKERGLYSGANNDGNWGPSIDVPDPELPNLLAPIDQRLATLTNAFDSADITASMTAWEKTFGSAGTTWRPLVPAEATALHGTRLVTAGDHSVLASGPTGRQNTYSITVERPPAKITGFRIEVLPHKSLPRGGPGRAGNGNFVLSELKASVESTNGSSAAIEFESAQATFEQADGANNPHKGWTAAAAIDGDKQGSTWGWAVMPQFGRANELVVRLKTPLTVVDGAKLIFRLEQNHASPNHTIGRFRLSATTDANVQVDPLRELPKPIRAALAAGPKRSAAQTDALLKYYRSIAPELADLRKQMEVLEEKRAALMKRHTRRTLITRSVKPRTIRVLPRGNWMDDSGEVVQPGVPDFLPQLPEDRGTRRDLADWIVSRNNPLTARVFVNRLWKLYFGTGLSKVLDDVGSQGEFPVHPQLLDGLAVEFVESGWDIKRMVRLIVMTSAYRQSSIVRSGLQEIDPYNRLVARQSRFRIDAEMIRDNTLAVSGLLVREIGGRSARPYQPAGLLRHLNFPRRTYQHDKDSNQYRRGVYTHWQRQFLHPAMKAFDAPPREECTAERPRSNTPLAALVMLNDPSCVEAARVFAERIINSDARSDTDRVTRIFQEALSRDASAAEKAVLTKLIAAQRQRYRDDPEAAKSVVATGLRPVAEGVDVVELAALLAATRAVFNMHEFITRN